MSEPVIGLVGNAVVDTALAVKRALSGAARSATLDADWLDCPRRDWVFLAGLHGVQDDLQHAQTGVTALLARLKVIRQLGCTGHVYPHVEDECDVLGESDYLLVTPLKNKFFESTAVWTLHLPAGPQGQAPLQEATSRADGDLSHTLASNPASEACRSNADSEFWSFLQSWHSLDFETVKSYLLDWQILITHSTSWISRTIHCIIVSAVHAAGRAVAYCRVERIWFVLHGAHPPRVPGTAVRSLPKLMGVCSRPLPA
jgi:hypothetical protein